MGVGDASVIGFLRVRFGFGEAAGDSAADGDVAFSVGEVGSAFLCVRYFAGEGDSKGEPVSSCDSTRAAQMVRPITPKGIASLQERPGGLFPKPVILETPSFLF